MNSCSAQHAIASPHPPTGRIDGGVGGALHAALNTTLNAIARVWRDHKARSDELRTFDSVADLNEHVLKDIGAPHWLISRAAARQDAERLPWIDMNLR